MRIGMLMIEWVSARRIRGFAPKNPSTPNQEAVSQAATNRKAHLDETAWCVAKSFRGIYMAGKKITKNSYLMGVHNNHTNITMDKDGTLNWPIWLTFCNTFS